MADINIQRKKSAPSPWILVLLAVIALAVAAYFFLRQEPADEPAPPNTTGMEALPADSLARATPPSADVTADSANLAHEDDNYTAETLAAQAAGSPADPNYAVNGLRKLTGVLVALADRDDLRDPTITEQRDNLTSATNRLGEANTSLRPGFVAAAGLIKAMQQKAYPELEGAANDLVSLAGQLSGRHATPADQQQNKQFLTQAAAAVRVLSEPAH
ncbi:hypothetical protein Q3A66_17995 [Hymenobacter sp. BT770]|uniref:hypothetical protein n=1 Tax=Hymenobacter sp. BT770 TaxID=2886942 RepID=UPI001D12E444|nr:hypothetical protein [Hymenobacter sp. BT770]MCC3155017.1 hypothetical protein [Hymenobacter sp. BT770]MDO3416965.1 hypothetical protein [Hymenobacter sp. BT770]